MSVAMADVFAADTQYTASFPSPNATEKVEPVLKTLSTEGPKQNLEKFSSFRTRCIPLHILLHPFTHFILDYRSDVKDPRRFRQRVCL